MLQTLKNIFNGSSLDDGNNCLINYVWLNKEADQEERAAECSVSFKHLDCAYKNARKYPAAKVKIWFDYRFLDDRSRACLQKHFDRFAPDNVEFSDINDIASYHDDKMFNTGTETGIWARVDLARLIVLDHVLKKEPEPYVFYADFDVPDLMVDKAVNKMDAHGLSLGSDGAESYILNKLPFYKGMPENGYFSFKKGENGESLLKEMILTTFDSARDNHDGYGAFFRSVDNWMNQNKVTSKNKLLVSSVLYSMGHEIPEKLIYNDWGWN